MKYLLAFLLTLAIANPAPAQDATPRPARKFLFFKSNSAEAAATPTPKPAATPKPATPRASKSSTPKAAHKNAEKAAAEKSPEATPTPAAAVAEQAGDLPVASPPQPAAKTEPPEKIAATPAPNAAIKAAVTIPAKLPANAPAKSAAKTETKTTASAVATPTQEKPGSPATPAVITSTVPPEPAQIVRAFFASISKGDIEGGYLNLMKGSKIIERPEEVRLLKLKTHEAVDVFGTVHGYDLVDSKPVGLRLVRATYVSLGHDYPLRWRFYFYRPEEVWKLIDIRVDDKLTGIFDETEEAKSNELRP